MSQNRTRKYYYSDCINDNASSLPCVCCSKLNRLFTLETVQSPQRHQPPHSGYSDQIIKLTLLPSKSKISCLWLFYLTARHNLSSAPGAWHLTMLIISLWLMRPGDKERWAKSRAGPAPVSLKCCNTNCLHKHLSPAWPSSVSGKWKWSPLYKSLLSVVLSALLNVSK